MSLSTASNRVVATGDGVTVTFYFNRLLYDATHLQVYQDATLATSGYTVSGVPGTSTYVTFAVAPLNGVQVLLLRVVPLTQLSVYAVGGAFPAATTEKNFDLAFMALQQFDEINDRAVTLPVDSTLTAADIPDPADPANYNRGIKIKGDGTGLDTFVISGAASGIVTTKGDLHIYGAGAEDRMPVGANGSFLIGASGETRGLKYFVPGTDGYVLQSDSAQTDKLIWVAPNQPANPIINGNMEIWQRGLSFATITNAYTADRWNLVHSSGASLTVIQNTDAPTVAQSGTLLNYSLDLDTTVADASIAAGDYGFFSQPVEGYNWRHFAQREITVSFWVKATKTGTYCFSIANSGQNRTYIAEYVVNSSDTWEKKTITIPASPSAGTWNYTNGVGVYLRWALFAGATYQDTGASWVTTGAIKIATSNQVNAVDNVNNLFRITGVKLELGSIATPIQFVPFEQELARSMRYYQKSFPYATAPAQGSGVSDGLLMWTSPYTATTGNHVSQGLGIRMRTSSQTLTTYNIGAANAQMRNMTDTADDSVTLNSGSTSDSIVSISFTPNAANTVGDLHGVHWSLDDEL